MAGLVPAIHALAWCTKNVDARDKPGHDELLSRKHQRQIVRGHVDGIDEAKAYAARERLDVADVAHAPVGIAFTQGRVEHGVAERNVLAAALERAVEEQLAVGPQIAARAGEQ